MPIDETELKVSECILSIAVTSHGVLNQPKMSEKEIYKDGLLWISVLSPLNRFPFIFSRESTMPCLESPCLGLYVALQVYLSL